MIHDEIVINLQRTKVYVFSDSELCLGKVLQHLECNEAWKNRVAGVLAERSYRDYDAINGESTEFEWNIFPGFTTLQLCDKISDLLSSMGQTPETFTGRILFMSMFNDISCDRKDNKDECPRNANIVKTFAGRFGIGQWSFIGPGSEKKWYPSENSPQGAWDHIAEDMLLEFAESGHPIFRATTPLSRGQLKSKGRGKLSIHFTADQDTVDTIYRIILFVNQLSVYGAVAAMCEEFEDHQDRTEQPVILVGQSIVLGEVKTETLVHDEDPRNDQIIWQQYIQQIESLSPENRLSKFCKEAGFMRVVEVGQYFVTKDTGQFNSVACREYTLPRDDSASQPKGWIQGNMRIGPVLEVTTSFQHFKYGIEIRIESVNQDNSHSCVRISYGTVKYVIDSVQDNTEIPADPQEEQTPQTSTSVVAARSKAKAKPQPRELVGTTATIPIHERRWIDIEPSKQDLASYDLSKKVIKLLRHNQTLQREEDGAVQFWRIKFHVRNHHSQIHNWSDDRWKACLAAGGESKRRRVPEMQLGTTTLPTAKAESENVVAESVSAQQVSTEKAVDEKATEERVAIAAKTKRTQTRRRCSRMYQGTSGPSAIWKKSKGMQGSWVMSVSKWFAGENEDTGLQTVENSKFFGIASSIESFSDEGKELFIQQPEASYAAHTGHFGQIVGMLEQMLSHIQSDL